MSAVVGAVVAPPVEASVERLVAFLERGDASGLFADDVFADVTLPHWRVQTGTAADLIAAREQMHPERGQVRVEKVLGDETGYAVKLEERWESGGQQWYCREAFLCELDERGRVNGFHVYCTGDWDEQLVAQHAEAVSLIRP